MTPASTASIALPPVFNICIASSFASIPCFQVDITIDLFFGTILSAELNYTCNGQVVEFIDISSGIPLSILFREGYDYTNNNCEEYADLNDDGNINIFDVDILVSYILDNSLYENGDFNQDGALNVFDVIMLIDMIVY